MTVFQMAVAVARSRTLLGVRCYMLQTLRAKCYSVASATEQSATALSRCFLSTFGTRQSATALSGARFATVSPAKLTNAVATRCCGKVLQRRRGSRPLRGALGRALSCAHATASLPIFSATRNSRQIRVAADQSNQPKIFTCRPNKAVIYAGGLLYTLEMLEYFCRLAYGVQ